MLMKTTAFREDKTNILLVINLDLFWNDSEKLSIDYDFPKFNINEKIPHNTG